MERSRLRSAAGFASAVEEAPAAHTTRPSPTPVSQVRLHATGFMGSSFVIRVGTCLKRLGEEQVHAYDVAVVLEEIVAVHGVDPPVLKPEVNLGSQVMGQ